MIRNYLYIKAGRQLDSDTRFYMVGVGGSAAQQKKKAWLQAFANEHGHFFVLWSNDAVGFYHRCQDSIGPNYHLLDVVSSDDLVRYLKTGDEEPCTYQAEINRHRILMQLDAQYVLNYNIQMKKQKAISCEASSK